MADPLPFSSCWGIASTPKRQPKTHQIGPPPFCAIFFIGVSVWYMCVAMQHARKLTPTADRIPREGMRRPPVGDGWEIKNYHVPAWAIF